MTKVDTTVDGAPTVDITPPVGGQRRRAIRAWAVVAARPVGVYLASRAVVLTAMWMASRIAPPDSLRHSVTAWDGAWYLNLAEHGYPATLPMVDGHVAQSTFAFFPLYPLCIR